MLLHNLKPHFLLIDVRYNVATTRQINKNIIKSIYLQTKLQTFQKKLITTVQRFSRVLINELYSLFFLIALRVYNVTL